MADVIDPVFQIPDNDFIELAGAGSGGNIKHQGASVGVSSSAVVFIESATKPVFSVTDPRRFQDNPTSMTLDAGESDNYYSAVAIWAISVSGTQLISVTPSA